jgi:hypothetical protein
MSYSNTKEMNDSIYSKSKPLHLVNIWNDNINNEVNYACPAIPIINTINIEYYDLHRQNSMGSCSNIESLKPISKNSW